MLALQEDFFKSALKPSVADTVKRRSFNGLC
jgi:hypothetical protein